MRVIAGHLRGRRLAEFTGRNVRPTPDRVREALFSIIQSKLGSLNEVRVLDLFSGSGALAIEALSRGAASACLVDKDVASGKIIRENLERCGLTGCTKVVTQDAFQALSQFRPDSFDLIFLDPPYNMKLAEDAILKIAELNLLSQNGLLCAETGAEEILTEASGRLEKIDQRRYGSVMIHFYSISDEG